MSLAILTGCAPHMLYTAKNYNSARFERDLERCRGQVATLAETPQGIAPVTPAQAIGTVIGTLIVSGMDKRVNSGLLELCLERRGYSRLELTREEQKAYSALQGADEKSAFLRVRAP